MQLENIHNKKLLFGFAVLFLMISFVNAVPPIKTEFVGNEGLTIVANFQNYYKINEGAGINIYVFNMSNGNRMDNTTTSCNVELTDRNGTVILKGSPFFKNNYWHMSRNSSIITTAGSYAVTVTCNTSSIAGYKTAYFNANELGVGLTDELQSNFNYNIIFLLVLFILSSGCLFFIDNHIGKLIFYWTSHLSFIVFTFLLWKFNSGYAITYFGSMGIWKVLFYFSIIAVVPVMIASISWIVYIHTYNEHFQKLIDKGCDTEEAFRITNKKKGWIYGN